MSKQLPEASRDCVWCCSRYQGSQSHARSTELFCSRRCETEARYWLFAVLSKVQQWMTGTGM